MSNIIQVTPTQSHVWTELAYKHRNDQAKLDQLKPLFKQLIQTNAPHDQLLKLFTI
jgi:hypothetical protein